MYDSSVTTNKDRPPGGRFRKVYWPEIVDQATARRAAGQGAAMAGLQAVVTLAFILWNMFYPNNNLWGFDAWNLVDVAVCAVLAWLIYWRLSRTAAVFALGYYVASQIVFFSDHPELHPDVRIILYSLYT